MPQSLLQILKQPASLAGLVERQPQGVVSRALIQNPAGSVTLFAFDAGQALNEHSAPFDALVQVLEGEGQVMCGETWHRLEPGQALWLPKSVPHALRADLPFKMMLVMLRA